jgi:hypothetical protein
MRQQLVDSAVHVIWQPRENIFQVGPWIMTVHLG